MPRRLSYLALALSTLLFSALPAVHAQGVSGAAAWQHVDALAGQIGSRPAGSAAYDRAVEYASDQLRQWGYQPALQSFPVQTYEDRGSRLEVTAGGGGGPTLHHDRR